MSVDHRVEQYNYGTYELGQRQLSKVIDRVYQDLQLLPPGSVVADLGCGAGRFGLNAPPERPYTIVGVDLSEKAVAIYSQQIQERGLPDEALVGDITNLDFLKGRDVQAIVSWRVLHCLGEPIRRAVLAQSQDLLPADSSFYLAIASNSDWKVGALRRDGGFKVGQLNDCSGVMGLETPFLVDFFDEGRLRLLSNGGFSIEQVAAFQEPTGYDHLKLTHPLNDYLFAQFRRTS